MATVRGYSADEVDVLTADFERVVLESIQMTLDKTAANLPEAVVAAAPVYGPGDAHAATQYWENEVDGVLTPYIAQVYTGSAAAVALQTASAFPDVDLPGVPLLADTHAITYMKSRVNTLYGVSAEMWEDIRNELVDGLQNGSSTQQVADKIKNISQLKQQEAAKIARTEMHSAVESGNHAQMLFMGFTDDEVEKIWEYTHDNRTRPTHVAAGGQRRPLNVAFNVGGSHLLFPGDPGGAADEIIHCRCTVLYDFDTPPKTRCGGQLIAAAASSSCIVPLPKADISHLTSSSLILIHNAFMAKKITPAYGGAKIHKIVQEVRAEISATGSAGTDLMHLVSDRQIVAAVDHYYIPKGPYTFGSKYDEWLASPAGKKVVPTVAPKGVALPNTSVGLPTPVAVNSTTYAPKFLSPPSKTGFKILDDPGASGDGTHPSGYWGKYGSAGVLTRALDADGVPRFLLIQRGEKYIGSQKFKWQLPGGGLDANEGPYEGTAREFWEETAATKDYVESMKPVGEYVFDPGGGWKYTSIGAHADHVFVPKVHGSTGDAQWFTMEQLQQMVDNGDIVKELSPTLMKIAEDVEGLAPPVNPGAVASAPNLVPKLPAVAGRPLEKELQYTGKTLGSHGAQVWKNTVTGEKWLFKPQQPFLTDLDVAVARVQSKALQTRPGIYKMTLGGKQGSLQYMFDSKDAFPNGSFNLTTLSDDDIFVLQREQIFDWMISNFDTHSGQWIRLADGTLYGTDKGQAFKFFGHDKLAWDYVPVTPLGSDKLTYSKMWKDFVSGGNLALHNPTQGKLGEFLDRLSAIDDKTYRELLRPYAEQVKSGSAVNQFLDAAVLRKNNLRKDFEDFWANAEAERLKHVPTPTIKTPTPSFAPTTLPKTVAAPPAPSGVPAFFGTPTPIGSLGDISGWDFFYKQDVVDTWKKINGGKSVTPAWGGSKIWKVLQDLETEMKKQHAAVGMGPDTVPNQLQLIRILDENFDSATKPKSYESVLKDWLASPAGQKAVPNVPPIWKSLPPGVVSAPATATTPIVSPVAVIGDDVTALINNPLTKQLTHEQVHAEFLASNEGDVIAYGTHGAQQYKVEKSTSTQYLISVRDATGGPWKALYTEKTKTGLSGIKWFEPPKTTKTIASKVPGKGPGDDVTLVDIEASKNLWGDGDIIATTKSAMGTDFQLISDGNGGMTLWSKPAHESTFLLMHNDPLAYLKIVPIGKQLWKLTPDVLIGTKKAVLPSFNAGDGIFADQIMSAPASNKTIAYLYDAATNTQYKVYDVNGEKFLAYQDSITTHWTGVAKLTDAAHLDTLTTGKGGVKWFVANSDSSMPDAMKLKIPGMGNSTGKVQSHAKGFFVGDKMDEQDILDAVFDSPSPGSVIAETTTSTGTKWRIIYDTDDNLHAQFYDTFSGVWQDGGLVMAPDEVPTSSAGWFASAKKVPAAPPKAVPPAAKKAAKKAAKAAPAKATVAPPPPNKPGVYYPGKSAGDKVHQSDLFKDNTWQKSPDGQIIAVKQGYAGYYGTALVDKWRLVKIDGKLVQQMKTKAGIWTQTKVIANQWDIEYGNNWILKDEALSAADHKKLSNAVKKIEAKKTAPPPVTATKASKAAKVSPSGGYSTPPITSYVAPHVDITPWNATEQKEMFDYIRGQNIYTSASPDSMWGAIQAAKQHFQVKYGGKYVKLNEIELLRIVDEQRALKKGIANGHWYEGKVMQWLQTPAGKAYVNKRIDAPITAVDVPIPMEDFAAGPPMDQQTYPVLTKAQSLQNRVDSHAKYGGYKTGEKSALREYTSGGSSSWNPKIRSGDLGSYRSQILAMQRGMRPSVRPMMLHRGTDFSEFNDPSIRSESDLRAYIGSTYINRGFNSTSFGGRAGFSSKNVILEIECPIGTPMNHVQDYSHFPSENEVELAAHLVFQIMSVRKSGSQTFVRVRVIGVGQP